MSKKQAKNSKIQEDEIVDAAPGDDEAGEEELDEHGLLIENDGADTEAPAATEEDDAPEDKMEAMKKRLEEANREIAEKSRENDELRGKSKVQIEDRFKAAEQNLDVHDQALDAKIEAHNAKIENLQEEIAHLMDSGEHAEALKKQREMNKLDFEVLNFQAGKNFVATKKDELKAAKENADVMNEVKTADDYGSESAATREWIKAHPQFKVNKAGQPLNRFAKVALVAHQEAIDAEDLTPGTPEYLRHIEKKLVAKGELKAADAQYLGQEDEDETEEEDEEPAPPPPPKKKKTATAAPGSSRSNSSGAGSKKVGKLTAEQVEAAKICGMSPEEYWESIKDEAQ